MLSREGILSRASSVAAYATGRRVRVAAQLLLVAAVVFVLVRFESLWRDGQIRLADVRWAYIAAALFAAGAALLASAFIWLAILRGLGVETERAWAGVFLQAQLTKYVPGSIWQYAGRGALGRERGISLRPLALSMPIELGSAACASAAVSTLLLGWWGAAGLLAALAALALALRFPHADRAMARVVMRVLPLYIGVSLLTGVSFWLVARAFVSVSVADTPRFVGAFAAAWVVGLVAVWAPGGIGVREAVLVALLHGQIGAADALVVAAASRATLMAADVLGAGAGQLVLRRSRPPGALADPGRAS